MSFSSRSFSFWSIGIIAFASANPVFAQDPSRLIYDALLREARMAQRALAPDATRAEQNYFFFPGSRGMSPIEGLATVRRPTIEPPPPTVPHYILDHPGDAERALRHFIAHYRYPDGLNIVLLVLERVKAEGVTRLGNDREKIADLGRILEEWEGRAVQSTVDFVSRRRIGEWAERNQHHPSPESRLDELLDELLSDSLSREDIHPLSLLSVWERILHIGSLVDTTRTGQIREIFTRDLRRLLSYVRQRGMEPLFKLTIIRLLDLPHLGNLTILAETDPTPVEIARLRFLSTLLPLDNLLTQIGRSSSYVNVEWTKAVINRLMTKPATNAVLLENLGQERLSSLESAIRSLTCNGAVRH